MKTPDAVATRAPSASRAVASQKAIAAQVLGAGDGYEDGGADGRVGARDHEVADQGDLLGHVVLFGGLFEWLRVGVVWKRCRTVRRTV